MNRHNYKCVQFDLRQMADVHEINKSCECHDFFFPPPIFLVIDFHLCTTRASGCDYICLLNDLGSWCTSNRACIKPDFYSDSMKIDQLVYIKHHILISWLTVSEQPMTRLVIFAISDACLGKYSFPSLQAGEDEVAYWKPFLDSSSLLLCFLNLV